MHHHHMHPQELQQQQQQQQQQQRQQQEQQIKQPVVATMAISSVSPALPVFDERATVAVERASGVTQVKLKRSRKSLGFTHSPLVLAMLTGNRMNNCEDVYEIHRECLATKSDDNLCNTASLYFKDCIMNHEN